MFAVVSPQTYMYAMQQRLAEESIWAKASQLVILIVISVAVLWGLKFVTKAIRRAVDDGNANTTTDAERRAETLGAVIMNTAKAVLGVLFLMAVLQTFGVNIGPLLAGASIAGVALGFGSQALVKDVINGFFLLLENQFGVGDIINVDDTHNGTVERMTLRVTMLRDAEGRAHYLPNGTISKVIVLSKYFSRTLVDITVGSDEDVDHIMGMLREVGKTFYEDMPGMVLEPTDVKGIEELGPGTCTIRTSTKTAPGQQWDVARELRRRILLRFRAERIRIPLPQRIVWNKGTEGSDDDE